jgi:hypothetical protein
MLAADGHLLKLQRLQNKILRTNGNFSRRTSVRDLHMAFELPFIYDYVTKLWRQQSEIIQNNKKRKCSHRWTRRNADIGYIKDLNLAAVKHSTVQIIRLLLQLKLLMIGHDLLY